MQAPRLKKALAGLAIVTGSMILAVGPASAVVPAGGASASRPTSAGNSMGPAFTGPTANLALVANHTSYKAKSVSTVFSWPAGLAVTNPITLRVDYGGLGTIAERYSPATGNSFHYDYRDPNGTAFVTRIKVTLTEQTVPGRRVEGGFQELSFEWDPMIEPLYFVHLGNLSFSLLDDCATWGDSNIDMAFTDPTRTQYQFRFATSPGHTVQFSDFAGIWSPVSNSADYYQPAFDFSDFSDFHIGGGAWLNTGLQPTPKLKLAPGTNGLVSTVLHNSGPGDCRAQFQYQESSVLLTYSDI